MTIEIAHLETEEELTRMILEPVWDQLLSPEVTLELRSGRNGPWFILFTASIDMFSSADEEYMHLRLELDESINVKLRSWCGEMYFSPTWSFLLAEPGSIEKVQDLLQKFIDLGSQYRPNNGPRSTALKDLEDLYDEAIVFGKWRD